MRDLFFAPTKAEKEKRLRLHVCVYAYAYEFDNNSLISDHEFDDKAKKINLSTNTDRPDLDNWFRNNFRPDTGMWIHSYPELDKIKNLYERHYRK